MRTTHWFPVLAWGALSLWACGDDSKSGAAAPAGRDGGGQTGDAQTGFGEPSCVPSQRAYAAVRPLFEEWCGTCHATEPKFGAPFSLLEYESVLGTHDDGYILDHMAIALREREMPPSSQPQPDDASRAALIEFATCGRGADAGVHEGDGGHTGHNGGEDLTATREPLTASATPPAGATSTDLTAEEFPLGENALDQYEQFTFPNLTEADVFVQRFEPLLDDERVVHHLTLRFTGSRQGYLYTWAPGGPAIDFPDGGIRLSKDDTLLLEIHYNNGTHVKNVKDSSGVRLWLGPTTGTEYGLANLATWEIGVPAGQKASAKATCEVQNDVRVFAAAPHMHGIGDSFSHTITRKGGAEEDLVSLTGWSFQAQRYYAIDVDLKAGDVLHMSCNYDNDTDHLVIAGTGTANEMCFDFMYVTPPTALENCNDSTSL